VILLLGCALLNPKPAGEGWGDDPDDSAVETDADTDSDGDTDADTDADTDTDTAAICVDAPVITWESWGQGFMIEACQGCHASTATNRYGAPTGVVFDTQDDVYLWRSSILARAAATPPTMPPAGGTTADDRYYLEVWLTCWLEQDVEE
jgi:uncharacterized membrane protein